MTVTEFKKQYPEYAHLEGNALWNKMEDVMFKNAHRPTPEEIEEFDNPSTPEPPLRSYRMMFIDLSDPDEED